MSIRIHIADDHGVFREGLRALVEKEPDMEVVSESSDTFQTLNCTKKEKLDVLLLDINMPGIPTSEIVRTVSKEQPHLAVLVLTIHDEEFYLREFLKAGARGFMVKTSTGKDLVQAIRTVYRGKQYIDPSMTQFLVSNYLGESLETDILNEKLTRREQEVCEKLALGLTNEEAAKALSLSRRTIESHRASIMSKLGLKSRAELVRFALQNGLLKP